MTHNSLTDTENIHKVFVSQAIKHDKTADTSMWRSALFCSKVVGKQDRGATLGLADDMGRSVDTVEDRAHGYWLFEKLCKINGGRFRHYVFSARRAPYIHFSHFRALWDIQSANNLTDLQVLSLLQDIVQSEGGISSRALSNHARDRFGDGRDWTWFAQRAVKEINKTLQQPDLPKEVRTVLQDAFSILGDKA